VANLDRQPEVWQGGDFRRHDMDDTRVQPLYPLGQRVEVCFRGERSAIAGKLELLRAPDYPWDRHQPLQLAVAGLVFSSRDIERWTIL
jgi:hypothetical protein